MADNTFSLSQAQITSANCELTTTAIEKAASEATRKLHERLEKEILGAWRADYDYLHVYNTHDIEGGTERFAVSQAVYPSDCASPPPRLGEYHYKHSYELAGLTPEEVHESRHP